MNEHDADIARLFSQAEPLPPSVEFAAAIRRAIDRERRKTRFLVIAAAVAMVLMVALGGFVIPFGALYPVRVAQEFVTSFNGMFICAACAVLMSAWLRLAAE